MGLHLLWSAKDVVILQQVWAVLTISQVVQALRLEIAGRAGVDPFAVSLALLVQYAPECARRGEDPVTVFVERGRAAGFIRPARRTTRLVPWVPWAHLAAVPPGTVLVRVPRYAQRKCGPRQPPSAHPPTHLQ